MNNSGPQRHPRHSIRLKGYDYISPGAYFITIVTFRRECLFGEIENGEMRLSETGKIVEHAWHDLVNHYLNIELGAFVIMPNHVHGIIVIKEINLPLPNP
jgi:REP element-mobilizing transposase RayT